MRLPCDLFKDKGMTASDCDTPATQGTNMARQLISRSSLQDGSFLERARAIPGLAVRSDGELEASLDETLAARPTDAPVWLFGYGSLMWNPAFSYAAVSERFADGIDGSVCGCGLGAAHRSDPD
jgi:hypothetical protein